MATGGAFPIVADWWGHQPGQTAVVGVLTDYSFKMKATIGNAPATGAVYQFAAFQAL